MPFEIRPEEEDALLATVAYHYHDYDLLVIRSPPHEHAPVRDSLLEAFPSPPLSSLGDLHPFPVEIIAAICLWMDVATLFRFRQINRFARRVISSLLQYRHITTHALEAYRATLRTRIGIQMHFTLADMHTALCSPECGGCGKFGSFVFLPTFTRVCWVCSSGSKISRVSTLSSVASYYGKPRAEMRRLLPVISSIPGIYSLKEIRRTGSVSLVTKESTLALEAAGVLQRPSLCDKDYEHACAPFVMHGVYWAMVTTAFPYLDRATGRAENGLLCRGCRLNSEQLLWQVDPAGFPGVDCTYTREAFLEHFKNVCHVGQAFWVASDGGIDDVEPDPAQELTAHGETLQFADSHEDLRWVGGQRLGRRRSPLLRRRSLWDSLLGEKNKT
ncbi:hypothetical protein F5144DRAFT_639034 [Chaetomium tenue]|uniref:Uncharacterized protein n=1 Tax=Chaetomium tenue TaxID=1854479 RepID=A0ACB7PS42_9PEZI|nr:hypothetical protein F5144DRAFT_639034 [Chaetomium globosum]